MMRIKKDLSTALAVLLTLSAATMVAHAQPTFEDAIPKIEARFEPATAKPGDVVTWKVTMDISRGWHTYPTVQVDPNALDCVNKFQFPTLPDYRFEGDIKDPAFLERPAPELLATRLRCVEGKVTWERKMRIQEKTAPGQ